MRRDGEALRPRIARLLMLGTPNHGSPCADVMSSAYEMVGKNVEVLRQMRQDVVNRFNGLVYDNKGVKFSALAGNALPNTCKEIEWNDGFVTVPSAHWKVADIALTKSLHTDLTGTSDFSNFVKPRLAIGPKGNHNPDFTQIKGSLDQNQNQSGGLTFVNAAYNQSIVGSETNDYRPDFAKEVNLAPKQIVEIEIPVKAGANLGLTFMANPSISATLIDDKGNIAGKNLSGTPESKAFFRSIYFEKSVQNGTWKIKLENTGTLESSAIIAGWSILKPGSISVAQVASAARK
jgi:hypothetical protein